MPQLDLKSALGVRVANIDATEIVIANQTIWPPPVPSLSDYYGTGPGQIPIHVDMLEAGSYTTGVDGADTVVTGLTNLGGTGAYHSLAADGVTTAPRLDNSAMLFRVGDLLRMAHEAQLDGVHALLEVNLTNPGINETQAMLSHSGASAGVGGEIQYMRQNTSSRLRIQNLATSQAIYAAASFVGAWRVLEIRYIADGTVYFAVDGTSYGPFSLFQGGDLYINMLGATMRNQKIGSMVSVITDSGYSMASPEPAVLLARSIMIGRR